MSQFFNNVEPNIIDDEMVLKAIEEKCPEDLGDLAKGENINFKDVTELQLSFKSILQIDNLWQLENLTKLQLDNNVIEKIEALESLVHLVWLDLSFNNIEIIEGLDTLVKLQDLSLYSNRISKIENMDALQELQIFSIGKNNLTSLEDVVYLRRFKKLRTLNLSGNPFCDDEQYTLFVVAHLPNLVYLDFKLVRDTTREAALSKYQDLIEPLEQEEARALALLEIKQAKQEELEYHERIQKLPNWLPSLEWGICCRHILPGFGIPTAKRKEFVLVCGNLYNYGLKEYEKREAEVSDFYRKLHEILVASQEESKKVMSDFENRNEQRLDEIHHARSYDTAESKRAECREDILQLSDTLMTLETLLSNELECRDLENHHHENLMKIVIDTLEKSAKGTLEENLPDDVQKLLVDKNTIVNAINMSHSIRLRKIDKRESDMLCSTYHWHSSVTEKAFQTEIDRNRTCTKKIISYINTLQKELDNTKI
ncbi:Dynein regulatory complex subunit 3 [Willisornis vidua]|uniref:Dynein regulatory complex subunit 3 n=1 Tax=Willisornis vidua TaxID=1566151 RepID=A0ABQ9CK97_9PASS|nr:Dynein regulatory complex subunit 3 [Willisornis vidua]